VQPLATSLQAFVLMYEHHTAREDTIVFTAWKNALSEKALDEMGEQFEDIEHREFGKNGFEDALKTIAGVEEMLSIADISLFTAAAPPQA
jgi:hemerythrin-like domain-containing protein